MCFSFETSNSRCVAILFGKDFGYKIHDKQVEENGNCIALDITAYCVYMVQIDSV